MTNAFKQTFKTGVFTARLRKKQLLKQRAEVLSRSVLPRSLLSEKDVAEPLQQVGCAPQG